MTSKTTSKPQQPQRPPSGFYFKWHFRNQWLPLIKMNYRLPYSENFHFSNFQHPASERIGQYHYSEFKSNLIISNKPWSGQHLVHLFTGPANMSRLSLSLPYKLKMSNDFLSQAYKGVTNWMTAFIDYTSNMHACRKKITLSISFCINIFFMRRYELWAF